MKRVRPDNKNGQSPRPSGDILPTSDGSKSSLPPHINELRRDDAMANSPRSRYASPANARDSPLPQPTPTKEPALSPRGHRPIDDKLRSDVAPAMPPPSVPSQTVSAQELRETAKQSISRSDKLDATRSGGVSPRRRSPSPASGPGTRNASTESRASGGRLRSDRGNADGERDDRRGDRETPQDSREHATLGRRDSLTHNRSERSGRERMSTRDSDKDGERDKERDRGRDRHSDREKERDRDIERPRDRERERDRERDRDRHRRDDKDRDRDGRKERDLNRGQVGSSQDLPTRPDIARHRGMQGEDGLGKRRRPTDDDVSSSGVRTNPRRY